MRGKKILGILAAAAAFGATAPAAEAAAADTAECRAAYVNGTRPALVCFEFVLGGSGTTVAPRLSTMVCFGEYCGSNDWVALGTTGYDGTGQMYGPDIDKHTLSIRWAGGSLGTVWVDGSPTSLDVPAFCVGDPTFCEGGSIL